MTKHILVVDPDASIVSAYKSQFESQGVMIEACETYDEAVELLNMNSYDVALIYAGQAEGRQAKVLDFLRLLRDRRPDVKIILMARGGSSTSEKEARALGVSFYFEKPVFSSTIFQALKELGVMQ